MTRMRTFFGQIFAKAGRERPDTGDQIPLDILEIIHTGGDKQFESKEQEDDKNVVILSHQWLTISAIDPTPGYAR